MAYTIQGSSQFTTQFPPGTVDIKFSKLRDVFKGPTGTLFPVGIVTTTGEITARELLRNLDVTNPDPILPDATENAGVSTASNWKASQMRGTIKFYVIDQTAGTTNDNTAGSSNPGFDFDGTLFNNCPDNINVDGYRQTEKYFKHIEDSIREDFVFKDEIYNTCNEFMEQFNGNIILLHIRRGDNVGRPDWYPMPVVDHYEYLLEKHFSDNQPVLI